MRTRAGLIRKPELASCSILDVPCAHFLLLKKPIQMVIPGECITVWAYLHNFTDHRSVIGSRWSINVASIVQDCKTQLTGPPNPPIATTKPRNCNEHYLQYSIPPPIYLLMQPTGASRTTIDRVLDSRVTKWRVSVFHR